MSIVKADRILFEYIRRDSDGNPSQIVTALNHMDLDVKEGEFVVIAGPNGSGKSTLAKHLNALLTPEEGDITIDGMDAKDPDNAFPIRRSVGMVFQNPDNQIVGNIVEEDTAFGPENIGLPTDEIWERVAQALEETGLWKYRKVSPQKLSGGQKQLAAIAGILAMRPKAIVLDEATSMLDPSGRRRVLEAVRELNEKKGITVILITHHMDEAAMADRVVVINGGEVVLDGTPVEVFSQAERLEGYGLMLPETVKLSRALRKEGVPLAPGIISPDELVEALCGILPTRA